MNHDTEFHQGCIDRPAARVNDVDIILSDRLSDADASLANAAPGDFSF